jgi:hypothetical protein
MHVRDGYRSQDVALYKSVIDTEFVVRGVIQVRCGDTGSKARASVVDQRREQKREISSEAGSKAVRINVLVQVHNETVVLNRGESHRKRECGGERGATSLWACWLRSTPPPLATAGESLEP